MKNFKTFGKQQFKGYKTGFQYQGTTGVFYTQKFHTQSLFDLSKRKVGTVS